jgi:hypothetical protein
VSADSVSVLPEILASLMERLSRPLIVSEVFILWLWSLMIMNMSHGSGSHSKSFDIASISIYLLNFALPGISFVRLTGGYPAFSL